MPTLETQRYLRQHGLDALRAAFGINARRAAAFPNLVSLTYSEVDSPKGEQVVRECRGLIVDEADDWRVASFPFERFFNDGEGHAAPIDWGTARVQEKLDGSLIQLYRHGGHWMVGTKGTPDASGPVHGHGYTFADLFWRTFYELRYALPPSPSVNHRPLCYTFELMTPANRVVVRHARPRLACIGARFLDDLTECDPSCPASAYGWEPVRSFPIRTMEECRRAAEALDPSESEGYVVVDAAFNRVKVKSPRYVALAHARDGCSPGRLLDLVRFGEGSEFLAHFPELRPAHDHLADAYASLCAELEAAYAEIRDEPVQKTFALAAQRTRCGSALFAVRAGKAASVRAFFAGLSTTSALERAMGFDPDLVSRLMAGAAVLPNDDDRFAPAAELVPTEASHG